MNEKHLGGVSDNDFKTVLLKRALGYNAKEVVEEFSADTDGVVKLTKKKVTTKPVPPDLTAIKLLIDDRPVSSYSDQELEEEKQRLLLLLKQTEKEKKEKKVAKKNTKKQ